MQVSRGSDGTEVNIIIKPGWSGQIGCGLDCMYSCCQHVCCHTVRSTFGLTSKRAETTDLKKMALRPDFPSWHRVFQGRLFIY